jgi:hypothetical protein
LTTTVLLPLLPGKELISPCTIFAGRNFRECCIQSLLLLVFATLVERTLSPSGHLLAELPSHLHPSFGSVGAMGAFSPKCV